MALVDGIAYWTSVHKDRPNTKFDPVWTIDVLVDKDKADELKKLAEAAKQNKGDKVPKIEFNEELGGFLVKLKQKVKKADGSDNIPPEVYGPNKEPFEANIGNGSEVRVQFAISRSEYKGRGFVSFYLRKVIVLKHVPYASDKEDEEFFSVAEKADKPKQRTYTKEEAPYDDDLEI